MVIITATTNQGGIYHTDEKCNHLPKNNRNVEIEALNGNWQECKYCIGEVDVGGHTEWHKINQRLKA